jgi:hypothetical protein
MSSIVVSGNTSGSVTLSAPAVAGSTVLTLPAVSGTVALVVNAPAFSAYQSTLQSVTGANVKILFQTEEFDTNSNYDTTTSRFTPTVAGYYQVSGGFNVLSVSTTALIMVYKNGVLYKYGPYPSVNSSSSSNPIMAMSCLVYCNGSTDYVEIWGSSTVTGNSNPLAPNTYFQAAMIRGA